MNSYEFHIGDYYKKAKNMSQIEHYIYRSLLDECYMRETPLPPDIRLLMREIGLTSDQKDDIEYILSRFFDLEEDGYHQRRVERVLALVYAKSDKARDSANRRWERYGRNANGKNNDANAMRTQCDSNANGMLPSNPLTLLPSNPLKDNVLPDGNTGENTVSTEGIPFKEIVVLWNLMAEKNGLPQVIKITSAMKGRIRQRHTDLKQDLNRWDNFFKYIENNDFLAGRAEPGRDRSTPFRSTLLWVTNETNFQKIAAKEYDQ